MSWYHPGVALEHFCLINKNVCQLRHQVDVIVFSQGVVVPEIASRFTHWELRQARRLQIADTPRHSADNKDYTDYTGLQGAAVLLLLLLHRMTESIIPTEQICREFAMLWETHCVSCVNMHFMCSLHYLMCNLHYLMCSLHYLMRNLHCFMCNLHCFMCILHHLMCNLHYLMCNLYYAHRSRCILRRAVRIPRDPTAVTLSGCDDRWTRVELDPPPLTHCSLSLTILTGKVDLRVITIVTKCDLL